MQHRPVPYACHSRPPLGKPLTVQNGWDSSWQRRMEERPFRLSTECRYTTSEQGKTDPQCEGCTWRAQ